MKGLFSHILTAVSGSEASIHAVKYSIVLAKQLHIWLSAVYVVDTATIRQLTLNRIFVPEESQEYENSLIDNGNRYLDYCQQLAQAKGVHIETELRSGTVYSQILEAAEQQGADLIVLGGWERDRSPREIIGTTHKEILYAAPCQVLVVKDQLVERMYQNA